MKRTKKMTPELLDFLVAKAVRGGFTKDAEGRLSCTPKQLSEFCTFIADITERSTIASLAMEDEQ